MVWYGTFHVKKLKGMTMKTDISNSQHSSLSTAASSSHSTRSSNGSTKKPSKSNSKIVPGSAGFAVSHPRQRIKARSRHKEQQGGLLQNYNSRQQSASPLWELNASVQKLEQHIPLTVTAQEALDRVHASLEALEKTLPAPTEILTVRQKLVLHDPTPPEYVNPFLNVKLFRATYEANDPTEDRSTVVIGEDFLFCGVWDGHGGYHASEYTQNNIYERFAEYFHETEESNNNNNSSSSSSSIIEKAFTKSFHKIDREYYRYAKNLNKHEAFFAGSCAIACFVDLVRRKIWCANLGDSRAVLGIVHTEGDSSSLITKPLSVDHSAGNVDEQRRIQKLHPWDPDVIVDMMQFYEEEEEEEEDADSQEYEEPPDWRVKKVAAFTRSIGDLQLKEKNTSALYNSYMPPGSHILPRPGVWNNEANIKTPPYISTDPDIKEVPLVEKGFLIIGCDGVWDEMSSEEAVECVAKLLSDHSNDDDSSQSTNIADLFIEKVLERAVERIRETDDYEADLTLEELKKRPRGKATEGSRSLLHDDITVVIVQLGTWAKQNDGLENFFRGNGGENTDRKSMRMSASSRSMPDAMTLLQQVLDRSADDAERQETDNQIVEMMEFFDGMNTRHLKILFNALDVDGSGNLDREEIGRLINQVMLHPVAPAVLELAFNEMDSDGNGDVDFREFVAFFGHGADA